MTTLQALALIAGVSVVLVLSEIAALLLPVPALLSKALNSLWYSLLCSRLQPKVRNDNEKGGAQ